MRQIQIVFPLFRKKGFGFGEAEKRRRLTVFGSILVGWPKENLVIKFPRPRVEWRVVGKNPGGGPGLVPCTKSKPNNG